MTHTQAAQLITFGETMALMMSPPNKGLEFTSSLQVSFGGAESNVAIGVARLGGSVGWCGRLGHDPWGRMIFKRIRGEGVDVSQVQFAKDAPTGLMVRENMNTQVSVYYYRKFSAASQMQPEDLNEAYIAQAKILHITGITPALSVSSKKTLFHAIDIAKRHGVKICFDPNLRLKLWPLEEAKEVIGTIAQEADYFLPGYDELQLLYGSDHWETILQQLRQLKAISIVKGKNQATWIVTPNQLQSVPYFSVAKVVDTIGAGDGFCAGFLSGILKGYDVLEAVKIGNLVGSLVIQAEGDWEGIPTWDEVSAILNQTKHIER